LCVCEGNFTGSDCSQEAQTLNVSTNSKTPSFNISVPSILGNTTGSSNQELVFLIGVQAIQELDSKGSVFTDYSLQNIGGFIFSQVQNTDISGATLYKYDAQLKNGAVV